MKWLSRIKNARFKVRVAGKCDARALWNGTFLLASER
jgi:hypothetical protein